jgi:hypothetical protein
MGTQLIGGGFIWDVHNDLRANLSFLLNFVWHAFCKNQGFMHQVRLFFWVLFLSMKGFSDVVWEQESYLNSIRNKYPNNKNNKILESYQNNL